LSRLVARASGAMCSRVAYCPTLIHAVVVRHIRICSATLATFAGTVADCDCVLSGHRCHFLSLVVSLGGRWLFARLTLSLFARLTR
jgi:hypothetical protein